MINQIVTITRVFILILVVVLAGATCWEIAERTARRFRYRNIRGGIGNPPTANRKRVNHHG